MSNDTIVIRRAVDSDASALHGLARLDSSRVPAGDLLVAEFDGELRAAFSVTDRTYIADPFAPTRDLVLLLDARAAKLRADTLPASERLRSRLRLWSDLWARAARVRPSQ
jgi:hypothetical protein